MKFWKEFLADWFTYAIITVIGIFLSIAYFAYHL